MRTLLRFGATVAVVTVAFLFGAPASAHHSRAGYDTAKDKLTTLNGVVAEVIWRNPHVYLTWDAKDEKGTMVRWTGEFSSTGDHVERGAESRHVQAGRSTDRHVHADEDRHTPGAGHHASCAPTARSCSICQSGAGCSSSSDGCRKVDNTCDCESVSRSRRCWR